MPHIKEKRLSKLSWDFKILSANIPKSSLINSNTGAKQLFKSLKNLLDISNKLENQGKVFEFLEYFYNAQNLSVQENLENAIEFQLKIKDINLPEIRERNSIAYAKLVENETVGKLIDKSINWINISQKLTEIDSDTSEFNEIVSKAVISNDDCFKVNLFELARANKKGKIY